MMGGAEEVVTQAPVGEAKLPDGKNLAQHSKLSAWTAGDKMQPAMMSSHL